MTSPEPEKPFVWIMIAALWICAVFVAAEPLPAAQSIAPFVADWSNG